jgi:hypothetical protein
MPLALGLGTVIPWRAGMKGGRGVWHTAVGRRRIDWVEARAVSVDGCPCWRAASERLGEALSRVVREDVPATLVLLHSTGGRCRARLRRSPIDSDRRHPRRGGMQSVASRGAA